ncbi:hypothetical protein H2O64_11670 [Kordia sp. YSTF-M3]|uniref:Polysaccharide biosynthesis protein C-terminal domain-containing protein n=1 Tax=Kordia aestuariivivens TaxID=2759037 RepID=A0ABR7Q9U5_9FLAO|nr:hypothetical protein [Kordia aestuariivivens]MBC8755337.1 hypothetical protein [Kordia aestuariivivens]
MNKLSKDVIISTVFSLLNVLFNFWLIKEAEYVFSLAHLGIFLYVRRIASTFSNFVQLGTSQALIRFTSIEKDNAQKIKIYHIISIAIWLMVLGALVGIYTTFHPFLSSYFFPNSIHAISYLKITFVYISMLHLSYVVVPYFLNLRKIFIYNLIQLLAASLVMLLVFKYVGVSITILLLFHYSLSIIFLLLFLLLIYLIFKLKLYIFPKFDDIKSEGKQFLKYGLPRATIPFSDMLLLTIGAMLIQGNEDIIGGFLVAITLSRAILIILQPVSLLSAVISGHGNSEEKHTQIVNLLVGGTIYIAIIAAILMYNWIDVLLPYWLKNEETIKLVTYIFKLLALGLVPYALFQALKGIIEIKYLKPLNLYTLLIGICSHVVLYYVFSVWFDTIKSVSLSLMISFILLGTFSLYWNRKYLYSHKYFSLFPLLILNVILFIINFTAHSWYPTIEGFLLSGFISGILFLIYCKTIKSAFLQETLKIFRKR